MADWKLRGDVLVSAREAVGMSRRALAAAIHLADVDRVGMWERGEARPHARVIPLIAQELRIDPLSLLRGDSDAPDLTRLRVAAGMSLQEMASHVGLPVASYHRLERRGAPVGGLGADTTEAIALTLKISITRVTALLERHRR